MTCITGSRLLNQLRRPQSSHGRWAAVNASIISLSISLSLSFYLSFSLSLCLSLSLAVHISFFLCLCMPVCRYVCLSVGMYVCLSVCLSLYFYRYLSLSLFCYLRVGPLGGCCTKTWYFLGQEHKGHPQGAAPVVFLSEPAVCLGRLTHAFHTLMLHYCLWHLLVADTQQEGQVVGRLLSQCWQTVYPGNLLSKYTSFPTRSEASSDP